MFGIKDTSFGSWVQKFDRAESHKQNKRISKDITFPSEDEAKTYLTKVKSSSYSHMARDWIIVPYL